jgi:hypothetical protein
LIASLIDQVLAPILASWSRREISDVAKMAERLQPTASDNFKSWIKRYKRRRSFLRRS